MLLAPINPHNGYVRKTSPHYNNLLMFYFASLLDSAKYSDLCIVCRGESWNVHRNVISTASSVLERMVDELPKASLPFQMQRETLLTCIRQLNPV